MLQGIVTVAAVNCDDAANAELCAKQRVKGYPTLKMFGAEKMKNPYTGEFYKEAIDFPGNLQPENYTIRY
jgi:protein disulfide-isomerase A6